MVDLNLIIDIWFDFLKTVISIKVVIRESLYIKLFINCRKANDSIPEKNLYYLIFNIFRHIA